MSYSQFTLEKLEDKLEFFYNLIEINKLKKRDE